MGLPEDGKYTCYTTMSRNDFFLLYSGRASPSQVASMCLTGRIKVRWFKYHELQQFAGAFTYSTENWIMFYKLKERHAELKDLLAKQWTTAVAKGRFVDDNGFIVDPATLADDERARLGAVRDELLGGGAQQEEKAAEGVAAAAAAAAAAVLAEPAAAAPAPSEAVVEMTAGVPAPAPASVEPAPATEAPIVPVPAEALGAPAAVVAEGAAEAPGGVAAEPQPAEVLSVTSALVVEEPPVPSFEAGELDLPTGATAVAPAAEQPVAASTVEPAAPSVERADAVAEPTTTAAEAATPTTTTTTTTTVDEPAAEVRPVVARVLLPEIEVPALLDASSAPAPAPAPEAPPSALAAVANELAAATDAAAAAAPVPAAKTEEASVAASVLASATEIPQAGTDLLPSSPDGPAGAMATPAVPDAAVSSEATAATPPLLPPHAESTPPAPSSPTTSDALLPSPADSPSFLPSAAAASPDVDMLLLIPDLLKQPSISAQELVDAGASLVPRAAPLHDLPLLSSALPPGFGTADASLTPRLAALLADVDRLRSLDGELQAAEAERRALDPTGGSAPAASSSSSPSSSVLDRIGSVFTSASQTVLDLFSQERKGKLAALAARSEGLRARRAELGSSAAAALQQAEEDVRDGEEARVSGLVLASAVMAATSAAGRSGAARSLSPGDAGWWALDPLRAALVAAAADDGDGEAIVSPLGPLVRLPLVQAALGVRLAHRKPLAAIRRVSELAASLDDVNHSPAAAAAALTREEERSGLSAPDSGELPLRHPGLLPLAPLLPGSVARVFPSLLPLLAAPSQRHGAAAGPAGPGAGPAGAAESTRALSTTLELLAQLRAQLTSDESARGVANLLSPVAAPVAEAATPGIAPGELLASALAPAASAIFSVLDAAHAEGMGGDDALHAPQDPTTTAGVGAGAAAASSSSAAAASARMRGTATRPLPPDGAAPAEPGQPPARAPRPASRPSASEEGNKDDDATGGLARHVGAAFRSAFGPAAASVRPWDTVLHLAGTLRPGSGAAFAEGLAHLPLFVPTALLAGVEVDGAATGHEVGAAADAAPFFSLPRVVSSAAASILTQWASSASAAVLDGVHAETMMWCLGRPLVALDRAPVTLGALELHASDGASSARLLPIWRPKRLATPHAAAAAATASPPSSSSSPSPHHPSVYTGYGSGLFLEGSKHRLRLQFEEGMAAAAAAASAAAAAGSAATAASSGVAVTIGAGSAGLRVVLRRGASPEDEASFLYGQWDDALQAAAPPRSRMTVAIVPPAALVDVAQSLRRSRVWKHYGRARSLDVFTADSHVFDAGVGGTAAKAGPAKGEGEGAAAAAAGTAATPVGGSGEGGAVPR
jgi:hypothetical protein